MIVTSQGVLALDTEDGEWVFRKALGMRIRVLRVIAELSQAQLAEAAGMSRNFVSSLERGAHGVDVVRLARLAQVLDVELSEVVADLFAVTDQPPAERSA